MSFIYCETGTWKGSQTKLLQEMKNSEQKKMISCKNYAVDGKHEVGDNNISKEMKNNHERN